MHHTHLSQFQQYQTLIYGVLMIIVILVLPNGLMSISLKSLNPFNLKTAVDRLFRQVKPCEH